MNSEQKYYVIPEFSGANIPVIEAAEIMKKDQQFIRQGMIQGRCKTPISHKRLKSFENWAFAVFIEEAATAGKF